MENLKLNNDYIYDYIQFLIQADFVDYNQFGTETIGQNIIQIYDTKDNKTYTFISISNNIFKLIYIS